ncbi:alanine--glyoxylate aminotransferase family protein [Hydrogenibacillus sp. N12]|uniref:pyridoxal-phosphate-dependent aminotransferase family protein n=1 Tax=Hydrogenibacillus sp. N12 TaxID=2866627 RepID=UPI001C7DFF9F|nr:alanine--glyoxylate aminotransferase family protein [Hydrogenibacillus sp. N12]QZA33997.1 alanine--glyoxylate aminotransferase family protein [Hydrogenibacillus sp. N12]
MLKDQAFLRIPGPTPLPPSVERAMIRPMIGHRDKAMDALIADLIPRLRPLFGTSGAVYLLAGSGTLALETALVNVTDEGDKVLHLISGAFGERFFRIAEGHRRQAIPHHVPWGEAVDPDDVRRLLQAHPDVRAVVATHSETSTGVLNPIADIARVVREHSDALLVVDAVSSLGGTPVEMDVWGVDAVATGSQKALMAPPGLALVALGERARAAMHRIQSSRFYADLRQYEASLAQSTVPFTPAVTLLFALEASLDLIEAEGLAHVFARHRKMRDMTRAALKALGVPLLAADAVASPTVTAVRPTRFTPKALLQAVRDEFGIVFASGQGKLKDEIFRIGHMGYMSEADVLQYIAALEVAAKRLDPESPLGAGIRAALEVTLA